MTRFKPRWNHPVILAPQHKVYVRVGFTFHDEMCRSMTVSKTKDTGGACALCSKRRQYAVLAVRSLAKSAQLTLTNRPTVTTEWVRVPSRVGCNRRTCAAAPVCSRVLVKLSSPSWKLD